MIYNTLFVIGCIIGVLGVILIILLILDQVKDLFMMHTRVGKNFRLYMFWRSDFEQYMKDEVNDPKNSPTFQAGQEEMRLKVLHTLTKYHDTPMVRSLHHRIKEL